MIIGQTVCFPGGTGMLSALIAGVAHIQTPEGLVQKPVTEIREIETPEVVPDREETRDTSQIPPEAGENLEVGVIEPAPLAPDTAFAAQAETLPPDTCIVASEGPLGPDSPSAYLAVDLPKRVTAKWLRERSPEELRAALKNPDLFGPRRERVKKELEERGL